jgi:hypothetical protein
MVLCLRRENNGDVLAEFWGVVVVVMVRPTITAVGARAKHIIPPCGDSNNDVRRMMVIKRKIIDWMDDDDDDALWWLATLVDRHFLILVVVVVVVVVLGVVPEIVYIVVPSLDGGSDDDDDIFSITPCEGIINIIVTVSVSLIMSVGRGGRVQQPLVG